MSIMNSAAPMNAGPTNNCSGGSVGINEQIQYQMFSIAFIHCSLSWSGGGDVM